MQHSKICFLVFTALILSACESDALINWQNNSALWNSQDKSYVYQFRTIPSVEVPNPLDASTTIAVDVRVTVVSDSVAKVEVVANVDVFGQLQEFVLPAPDEAKALPLTIDAHFSLLFPMLINNSLSVEYDELMGYPISYSVTLVDQETNEESQLGMEVVTFTANVAQP